MKGCVSLLWLLKRRQSLYLREILRLSEFSLLSLDIRKEGRLILCSANVGMETIGKNDTSMQKDRFIYHIEC